MKTLPIAFLKARVSYDPETGVLRWKPRPASDFSSAKAAARFNTLYAGQPAGGKAANGYVMLPFRDESGKRCLFYAHRIAWALHFGKFPETELDHINGRRTDNRILNLREATRVQNAANSVFKVQNLRGTRRHPSGKWIAQISIGNRSQYLGLWPTESEAYAAFCGAATVMRKHFKKLDHRRG